MTNLRSMHMALVSCFSFGTVELAPPDEQSGRSPSTTQAG